MLIIKRTNSNNSHFRAFIPALDTELHSRNYSRQDVHDIHNLIEYLDTVVVAYMDELPVGCGCFKKFDRETVKLKRMFVERSYRGKGIASEIIRQLESWAGELGYSRLVLETGTRQQEAINVYQRNGYSLIENYGPYIGMNESICMEKFLTK
jgi:putative acetyltransferase